MRRIYKKLIALVIVILIIPVFAINSFAAQLVPGARWCHMSSIYNGTEYIDTCILTISTEHMSGYWTRAYDNDVSIVQRGIDIWNDYSNQKVKTINTPFSSSKIDMLTYSGTADEWETLHSGVAAFTIIYSKNGNQYSGGDVEGDSYISNFGNRITAAGIIFHPSYLATGETTATKKLNLVKNVVHELGHCLNLGHPATSEEMERTSVMMDGYPAFDAAWNNYPCPTNYDLSNIAQMYDQIYS